MSSHGFQLILLTPPVPHPQEMQVLAQIMSSPTPPRLHLRRPAWSRAEMATWLKAAPTAWLPHVVLHAHHALATDFAVGGVHLTAGARAASEHLVIAEGCTMSTALHSLAEVRELGAQFDYVFLSPIFNSISKPSYPSAFALSEVSATLQTTPRARVVALGGIEEETLPVAQQAGFAGAAVLGAVWKAPNPWAAWQRLQTLVISFA